MKQLLKKYAAYIVMGALVFGFFSYQSMRNKLILLDETVNASWAQVENQLQRRYDLIPNLVSAVKGYAEFEKEVFSDIAKARSALVGSKGIGEKIAASSQMESALSRLLVISERYPNLKANESFRQLTDELSGTENRLSVERRRFNDHVKKFNRTIRTFPYSYVAGAAGFEKMEYFQINQAAKEAPKVSF